MRKSPFRKIHDQWEAASRLTEQWKKQEEKVVFTNGCFDLIHRGHITYLKQAAELGDRLVVGLNSDASVRSIKGMGRPIKDEMTRAEVLAAFYFVDLVVLFSDDTPLRLIKEIRPDILVKGGDYKPSEIIGYDYMCSIGGKVLTFPFLEGHSSTGIIEKILKNLS